MPGCGAWQPEKITVDLTRAAFHLGLIGRYSKHTRVCWRMRWGGWGVELSTLLCVSGIRGSEERHTYTTTTKSYLYIERDKDMGFWVRRETKTWDSGYTSRADRIGKNQDGHLGLCRALFSFGSLCYLSLLPTANLAWHSLCTGPLLLIRLLGSSLCRLWTTLL